MAVVSRTSQTLGGDRATFAARTRLEQVKEAKANGLLQLIIAFDNDVCVVPEFLQVGALRIDQAIPTSVARLRRVPRA